MEKLVKNFEQAKHISSGFYKLLWERDIKCKYVLLRAISIIEFESVFVVPKSDYISPAFIDIYRLSIEEKKKARTETFHFSFVFMPDSKHINREKLVSDGFILRYTKKR